MTFCSSIISRASGGTIFTNFFYLWLIQWWRSQKGRVTKTLNPSRVGFILNRCFGVFIWFWFFQVGIRYLFLQKSMCMVYTVRPAVCRTCTSTSAEHCEMIFESRNHRARLRCYPKIREIFHTVHSRLIDRCREMNCQSEALQIQAAIEDYLDHPQPFDAWFQGETVFHLR